MSADKRPPFRWFLIGPKRSGTTLHVDPLMTSAWNTSLNGHKLWVMFPWKYPKWLVNGKQVRSRPTSAGPKEDNEAIDFFAHHLPRIKQEEGPLADIVECIQKPGETVFVPGGWWHAVLNLDDTMAVTQNFCNLSNFDRVWRTMRIQRPQLSRYFLHKLKLKRVDRYKRAIQLNALDKFVPVELRAEGNFLLDDSTDSHSDSSSSSSESSEKSLTDSSAEERAAD